MVGFGLSEVDNPALGSFSDLSSLISLDGETAPVVLGKWCTVNDDEVGDGEREDGETFCVHVGEELLHEASCLDSCFGSTTCVEDEDFGNWRNFCKCSCCCQIQS